MPNRKKMPRIREVKNLVVPPPEIWHLSNGIPVYETNLGTQDILKLELVFFAGRPFERKKLASRCVAALMREGTKQHSSAELAEVIDYYGGSLSMPISMDMAGMQLHTLTKHFDKLLPLATEMLSEPLFPQEEIDSFVVRNKQRLQVDLTKNDFVAYRKFTELLYGEHHPYGYNSYPETYEAITRDDLLTHFKENYTSGNCLVFLSGRPPVHRRCHRPTAHRICEHGGQGRQPEPRPLQLLQCFQLQPADFRFLLQPSWHEQHREGHPRQCAGSAGSGH